MNNFHNNKIFNISFSINFAKFEVKMLFVILAVSFLGCNKSKETINVNKNIVKTYMRNDAPGGCANKCWETCISVIRAELSLDPDATGKYDIGNAHKLLESLQAEVAGREWSAISLNSLEDCLRGLGQPGPFSKIVLSDSYGHLYLIIGCINSNGQQFYQFIHGNSSINLVSFQDIKDAGFENAWALIANEKIPITVKLGNGLFTINKLFHNFGGIQPNVSLNCVFRLQNVGGVPLTVDTPRPSCSCTTVSVKSATALKPGELLEIPASIHTSSSSSLRQYIEVKMALYDSFLSRDLTFELCGSQFGELLVVPRALNFGTLVPNREYTSSFILQETPTDRFSIISISSPDEKMKFVIGKNYDHHNLCTYKIYCTLYPKENPGNYQGLVSININNQYKNYIYIPLSYRIDSPIRAIPSVVSFERMLVGIPEGSRIEFVSRNGEKLSIGNIVATKGIRAYIDRKNSSVVNLTMEANTPGICLGSVKVEINTSSGVQLLDIPCTGFAKN